MIQRGWRITKAKHADDAFTGAGAKAFGGRWNSPGTAVVYVAGSVSLAILEMLVHLQAQEIMARYVVFEVTFDSSLMTTVDHDKLPDTWRRSPTSPAEQNVGDQWVSQAKTAVLRLPSVIVPSEWNFLLNPAHKDYKKVSIGPSKPISFDPRLVKTVL